MSDLSPAEANRVAIVTGAGRGIGAAIARRLRRDGARLVLVDSDPEAVGAIARELKAEAIIGDVADPAVAQASASCATEVFGGLDVVVTNAGVMRDAVLHKMTDAQWDLVVDTSLRGSFNFLRATVPLLKSRAGQLADRQPKVVAIASTAGIYGRAASANYSAAKAGLIGLVRAASRELAPFRINVNAVAPGHIAGTALLDGRRAADNEDTAAIRKILDESVPIGRPGRPEDVAAAVAFLCSPDADYVTGHTLELHGGLDLVSTFPS